MSQRYGLLKSYVGATGKLLYVVAAEPELRAMAAVTFPESGIALMAPEVIELAQGAITIEGLVRRSPELFQKKVGASKLTSSKNGAWGREPEKRY